MKKFLSLILSLSMMLSCMMTSAFAENEISITINGEAKTFDVMPVIEDSRVLVPMRGIFEALGAEISWDDKTRTVTAVKDETTVTLEIGSNAAKVNETEVALDVPARLISSRTMVPIRFVSEALSNNVDWDEATNTVIITTPSQKDKEITDKNKAHMLDGKKFIFIGNSHIYRGMTVLRKGCEILTQEERSNDHGYFYQLCKKNGAEVSVTNWTFGNHGLRSLFGAPCNVNDKCKDENHEEYLADKYFDYVVINPGVGKKSSDLLLEDFEYIIKFFREVNPDVKFICLGNASVYGCNKTDTTYPAITGNYKTIEKMGVTIADWGRMVKGLIDGEFEIPDTEYDYIKSSFIVSDNYHPNMLSGYITTLFTYCAITGESAVGQPYDFIGDDKLNKSFDITAYANSYYTNGTEDTNADEIITSESDIKGIQQLIDECMKAKLYLKETAL